MHTYFSFEFTGWRLIDDGLDHLLHAFWRWLQYDAVRNALGLAASIRCSHHILARVRCMCCV